MISFLAPMALAGLALLAVPVFVHLFKPKRVRVVPFSSLRWLRASQHRLSRRVQWHQVLLFLLRAALIAALVAAAARPVFSRGGRGGQADRIVLVDAGRTLAYASPSRPRPIETARVLAERLVAAGNPGDRTAVLVAGAAPEAFGPLLADPAPYADRLRDVRATGAEPSLADALRLVPPLLQGRREGRALDLFVLTDNLAPAWSQLGIADLLAAAAGAVRVHVLDVGVPDARNAWIASAAVAGGPPAGPRTVRVTLGASGERAQPRRLRLAIPGMPDLVRDLSLEGGRRARLELELPPALELDDRVGLLTLEPPDALPDDDRWWLELRPRGAVRVLVIEPEATLVNELRPAFYLRTALDALAEAEPGRFEAEFATAGTVGPADVEPADVVVLAEPPDLPDAVLDVLRERVAAGAGLAVFLGPSADRTFYGSRLCDPLRPSQSLLTRAPGAVVDARRSGALARLEAVRWEHPLLAGLFDAGRGDLADVRFTAHARLEAPLAPGGEQVIARFSDETPAIIESGFGAGRVVLLNTTAHDAWSDLPRRKSFVPLVDRLVGYLSGNLDAGRFRLGAPALCPLPRDVREDSVTIVDPVGKARTPAVRRVAGRPVAALESPDVAGVYELRWRTASGPGSRRFVVQAGRERSVLEPMDDAVLRRWWEPAACSVTEPDPEAAAWRAPGRKGILDPWLMALAVLLLAAETLLACKLCPRAHAEIVSESVVSRRGFFDRDTGAVPPGGGAA